MNMKNWSIKDIQRGYINKDFTVVEVVKAYLNRIKKVDGLISSFLYIDDKLAIRNAENIDDRIKDRDRIKGLTGIPLALSDNICTRDMDTSCGSKILKGFLPAYDASLVEKIKSAGGIILGKTNMDEFGLGSSTEESAFQTTKNPWNPKKIPGGAAGGAAAAVASGLSPLALASDNDGSLRQAASFCGLVGLKPSYGLVSRYGLISPTSSLDQIGLMAKNVEDCALGLGVIQGRDPMDSSSYQASINKDYIGGLKTSIDGRKIGIPIECFNDGLDGEILDTMNQTIKILEEMGVLVEEFSMDNMEQGLLTHYMLMSAEASSNLARYDGIRYGHRTGRFNNVEDMIRNSRSEGFGQETKRRITLGGLILTSKYYNRYYYRAVKIREQIKRQYTHALQSYDFILTPTSPILAHDMGLNREGPLGIYKSKPYTVMANLTGLPALSLPCGFSSTGLPIGLELMANYFREDKLLNMAYFLERELGLNKRSPDLEDL